MKKPPDIITLFVLKNLVWASDLSGVQVPEEIRTKISSLEKELQAFFRQKLN